MNENIDKAKRKMSAKIIFAALLAALITCLIISVVKTNSYNKMRHHMIVSGADLFSLNNTRGKDVSVTAAVRNSTWGKIYDPENFGLTENNIQAHTYDFTISNHTKDEVSDFIFKLTFNKDVFLSSGWNGKIEVNHERYDGKGYPEGKAGEDIPFVARMICVADSFDAMNSNRVYRKLLSKERIIEEIETNKGRQFDPKVADVMLRLLRDGTITMKG